MADESVHEIQLNGKQLVFMFMATTVVAVVIFLSGVMVGRGVPARRAAAEATAATATPLLDPTAPADAGRAAPARTTGTTDAPVTTQETLTYAERLEAPTPARETLREIGDVSPSARGTAAADTRADQGPIAKATAGTPLPDRVDQDSVDKALAEPAGAGWAVQVMAVPAAQRGDAEALARRLSLDGDGGAIVLEVQTGGPGDAAGVLVGDVLVTLDGTAVHDTSDVLAVLGTDTVGRTLSARLVRAGELVELPIAVAERPRAGGR
jgi:hypothetical protein